MYVYIYRERERVRLLISNIEYYYINYIISYIHSIYICNVVNPKINPPFGDGFFIAAMMVVLPRICPGVFSGLNPCIRHEVIGKMVITTNIDDDLMRFNALHCS